MAGRWQREGAHTGTPADPIVKHLDGVPWYAAPLPWILHRRCRPQTVELWWQRTSDGRYSQFPAGGTLFCACGSTADLDTNSGWVGRNRRRCARLMTDQQATVEFHLMRIEPPTAQAALRVTVGR